ncbi:hypothetical protein [Streptomyces sp. NPDC058280]|uniref:SbtR family transcriptional regulator n=1 Tax=Streptomyces sp. NPDC058280 TaxID=3346419 RepID=UPI0036F056D2
MADRLPRTLRQVPAVLLRRTQQTGAVRGDVGPEDLRSLLVSCSMMEQLREGSVGTPGLLSAPRGYDSDQVQRKLRNEVRPGHAPMRVDAVHLVDVTADAQAKAITWDHVASALTTAHAVGPRDQTLTILLSMPGNPLSHQCP